MGTLNDIKLGFAMCGSFCTLSKVMAPMQKLIDEGADVYPIMSEHASSWDTRFGTAEEFRKKFEEITGHPVQNHIVETERIGPLKPYNALIVAPCTGNTMAKMANGITDTAVLMAIKATLRNEIPVIIALATNDALGLNLKNLGTIMNTKNVYLVPLCQDDAIKKPSSMVADMDKIYDTLIYALQGKQIQPVILQE